MKINTKQFLSAIQNLIPLTTGRTTMPVLSCLRLECDGKTLSIQATNLDEFASATMEAEGELAPVCVFAKALTALLDGDEVFELSADKNSLQVKCGGMATLNTEDATQFPAFPSAKDKIAVNCPDLAASVNAVYWATAKTEKSARMDAANFRTCFHVQGTAKTLIAEATNALIYAYRSTDSICSDFDVCVPDELASRFVSALNEIGAILVRGENHIGVTHESGSWFGRLSAISYPVKALADFRAGKKSEIAKVDSKELVAPLKTCQSFVEVGWLPVDVDYALNQCTVSFNNGKNLSQFSRSILAKTKTEYRAKHNLTMLLDVVAHLDGEITVSDADGKIHLTDGTKDIYLAELKK